MYILNAILNIIDTVIHSAISVATRMFLSVVLATLFLVSTLSMDTTLRQVVDLMMTQTFAIQTGVAYLFLMMFGYVGYYRTISIVQRSEGTYSNAMAVCRSETNKNFEKV